MNNNTILSRKCEASFLRFAKFSVEGCNKVKAKFCSETLNGILKSSSVLLSEIVRKNDRKVEIKNGVERLSRQLEHFNGADLFKKYLSIVKPYLPESPLFLVDGTDLVKPCAKKMEALGLVADGSDANKLKMGYLVNEITAVATNGQPVSVSSILYSAEEKAFLSANTIVQKAVLEVCNRVSKAGTFVFDRGFDDIKLHRFLNKHGQKYIIRAKSSRNIISTDLELNIKDFAKLFKGKYAFGIKFQSGAKENLKASFKQVYLPKMPETPLNLVVVFGFSKDENEPFYLLTNREVTDKDSCLQVVRDYLSRWKIEEYFKFKKQAYAFENVRVRKLAALKNLNLFLTLTIGFLGIIRQQIFSKMIIAAAEPIKEKVAFDYYRLHAGFMNLIPKFQANLIDYLYPPKKPKRYDLFHYIKYINRINNLTKSA